MDQDTSLIMERFNALPEAVRSYVITNGFTKDVQGVASAFNLDETKTAALENEIMMVMLVMTPEEALYENIVSKVGIDAPIANELTAVVQRVIFAKLVTMLPAEASEPVEAVDEAAKRQQLADLAERFAPPPTQPVAAAPTYPAANPYPVTPLESAAERLASVPVAKPLSSAALTSMSIPVAENQLQPTVAAAAQNVPPAWTSGTPAADVQPMRTMGEDIQRIHGYGAYREQYPNLYQDQEKTKETIRSVAQDALLKRAPVVETPNFNNQQS